MSVNESLFKIKWEPLQPGPIGEYVEVIDFDPVNFTFYEPVYLDAVEIASQQGVSPSEGSPKFHQQFVYAVVMQTIENFEKALGRKIIWREHVVRNAEKVIREDYVRRLRIYPHAMMDANAFYSPEKVALLFGYFQAGSKIEGSNFPGGAVFTCLSPDIIAHETTHAILDGIFPRYLENTNPDVPAFHEAFGDIVALLQRFSNIRLLEHQIEQTRGRLDQYSIMGELATQFGQALETGRGALRSAIGKYDKDGAWVKIQPDPSRYKDVFEAHERGAILVATVFEAFMRLYNFRVQDILRIATQGTGVLPQGSIHPDLVKRLAAEAADIASHLLWICIRALDYSPPFDITFGDYLRALITADLDLSPDDNNGFRVALIEAFRAWGIFPERVQTLSLYSLKWKPPALTRKENLAKDLMVAQITEDVRKISRLSNREKIAEEYSRVQKKLCSLLLLKNKRFQRRLSQENITENQWSSFLTKLGIVISSGTPGLAVRYKGKVFEFGNSTGLDELRVRPAFRIGREGTTSEQVIITICQSHKLRNGAMRGMMFHSGATIVLSILNDRLVVDYIVSKKLKNGHRLAAQIAYQTAFNNTVSMPISPYEGQEMSNTLNFERLHLH